MTVTVRTYEEKDLTEMVAIWNEVVEEGTAFPQEEFLTIHICNASYAVSSAARGMRIGEKLVMDCLEQGRRFGFGVLQFNAVVASNLRARRLYEKLGFCRLGTIPGGFRMNDGRYEDICPYYYDLRDGFGGADKEK